MLLVKQKCPVGFLSEGHSAGSHSDHGVSLVLGVSQLHPLRSQVGGLRGVTCYTKLLDGLLPVLVSLYCDPSLVLTDNSHGVILTQLLSIVHLVGWILEMSHICGHSLVR